MKKLNIQVNYSALYRPESQGLLERQHRDLKESLKAALEDMVEKHQSKWLDQLPLVLLGKRVTCQPDIGASPCELAMGMNVRIPGQILRDPGELQPVEELKSLLEQVRMNTANPAVQTSMHKAPEKPLAAIPEEVTHVYTRQHKATGLQTPWEGPFRIESRPSRSTVQIDVGSYKSGERRYEVRHFNDLKLAHPDSLAAPAERPRLGRPPRTSASSGSPALTDQSPDLTAEAPSNRFPNPPSRSAVDLKINKEDATVDSSTHATSSLKNRDSPSTVDGDWTPQTTGAPPHKPFSGSGRPARSTRNPNPAYIDAIWQASPAELDDLNKLISNGRKP